MKHRRHWKTHLVYATLAVCLCGTMSAQAPNTAGSSSPSAQPEPIVLDRVIAVINGDVLLESDVREEMRLAALQPITVRANQNNPVRAVQRLISRTLILRQMKGQQQINYSVTDDELKKSLMEVREQIPVCKTFDCATPEGWHNFLASNGLTEEEVEDRWRQRLEILKFIEARFGTSIRVTREDIQNYYQQSVVPVFQKEDQKAPTVDSVSPRIREILLQQQVNVQLREWLQSLREQGSVQILDPAYGQSTGPADEDTGGGA
jgi:hypothetical protein